MDPCKNCDKKGLQSSKDCKNCGQEQPKCLCKDQNFTGSSVTEVSLTCFYVLYVLTILCGLVMIGLIYHWVCAYFGCVAYEDEDHPENVFNWHPIFMTFGFIFLYGNSIMIYRGLRCLKKIALKICHFIIHTVALIITVCGLLAALQYKDTPEPDLPHMYSLHSWLGLTAVIFFCLQYLAGFITYLVPGIAENCKIGMMPLHRYFGLFAFVLGIATALMGVTQKAILSIPDYSDLPDAGVTANICGIFFVIFGGLVVYLVTEPSYRRQPLPEETAN